MYTHICLWEAVQYCLLQVDAQTPWPLSIPPSLCTLYTPPGLALQAVGVLDGRWKLVYTTNAETLMLLNAIDSIPLVDIGDVYQVIVVDGNTVTAHNKVGGEG